MSSPFGIKIVFRKRSNHLKMLQRFLYRYHILKRLYSEDIATGQTAFEKARSGGSPLPSTCFNRSFLICWASFACRSQVSICPLPNIFLSSEYSLFCFLRMSFSSRSWLFGEFSGYLSVEQNWLIVSRRVHTV